MTLFHPTHHSVARSATVTRRPAVKAPRWFGQVAWTRLAGLSINLGLWALIILGVRALLRL